MGEYLKKRGVGMAITVQEEMNVNSDITENKYRINKMKQMKMKIKKAKKVKKIKKKVPTKPQLALQQCNVALFRISVTGIVHTHPRI